jgi:predicted nucleic acid-binding protein
MLPMLVDSNNIIIYAAKPEHPDMRSFIAQHAPAISAVSYVEVLGDHKLTEKDRSFFEAFFRASRILSISQTVVERIIRLRQIKKMSFGDALIAGTALRHDLTLVTRNETDFAWIAGLQILNPFDSPDATS